MVGLDTLRILKVAGRIARLIQRKRDGAVSRAYLLADNRLALARRLGATHTLNPSTNADIPAEVARLTDGLGADVSLEVVGVSSTVNLSLAVLKRGGSCVLVGNLSPKTQDFPLQAIVTKELTVVGTCSSAGEYPLCLDLIARGVIDVKPMIETVAKSFA